VWRSRKTFFYFSLDKPPNPWLCDHPPRQLIGSSFSSWNYCPREPLSGPNMGSFTQKTCQNRPQLKKVQKKNLGCRLFWAFLKFFGISTGPGQGYPLQGPISTTKIYVFYLRYPKCSYCSPKLKYAIINSDLCCRKYTYCLRTVLRGQPKKKWRASFHLGIFKFGLLF